MEEKPNYYAIIPAEVRYDKTLRANEKLLYGEIVALSNKTGICNASNNYFSKLFNVVPSAISKWIKDLENQNYISVEYFREEGKNDIKERQIRLNVFTNMNRVFTNMNRVFTKIEEGYSQKLKENNTSINNIYNNNNNKEKNIFEYIEENFGRTLAPIEYEEIKSWEDNDLTRYAIKQAVLGGIYNLKYISKILYEYKKNNIKTVQEAQLREEQYKKSKTDKTQQQKTIYKTSRDKLKELEEQARIDDEREALENAKA